MFRFQRALLIANPVARTVSPAVLAVIEKALSADLKLDVIETLERGHATEAARDAVTAGDVDIVIVFSGDGTINEAINGLAGTEVALGVLPGGATNILVRALGLPLDPVEATGRLIDSALEGRTRTMHLGRADGRFFAINCGAGLDAAAMERLDHEFPATKRAYERAALSSVVRELMGHYAGKAPDLGARVDGEELSPSTSVMIGRTDPYTYYKERRLHVTPLAELGSGLDVCSFRRFRRRRIPRMAWQVFRSGAHIRGRDVDYAPDVSDVWIESATPFPVQVDGDAIGHRTSLRVDLVRDALRVVAEPPSGA
jgi:diacylglycerol kinase family enzyme